MTTADWPMLGGDPAHTRFNRAESTLDASNVGSLVVKWATPVGDDLRVQPVVAAGIAYDVDYTTGRLTAMDAMTGVRLWSTRLDNLLGESTPAVANGVLYIGSLSSSGQLWALDAITGEPLWHRPTGVTQSSPSVRNGIVYVEAEEGLHGWAYAFDAATGANVWREKEPSVVSYASPAERNGLTVGASADGIHGYDAVTGVKVWKSVAVYTAADTVPTVAGGEVFAKSDNGELFALDATDGSVIWSTSTGARHANPAAAYGLVFDGADRLYARDGKRGVVRWHSLQTGTFGEPMVANGVVYAEADGTLYAFNYRTGAQLWSATGGYGDPIVVNGMLYASSSSQGKLVAFGLP